METKEKNLELWKRVEKTDPKHTKKAKIGGGHQVTAISPQYQILNATKEFGSYGSTWGFKNIQLDYSLTDVPVTFDVKDWKTKQEETINSVLGLVGFKATFFYPQGEFEITNSIKIFTDNKHHKIDDNYAKKVETDALTKALSKLGFNADVFMGRYDDVKYVNQMAEEFKEKPVMSEQDYNAAHENLTSTEKLTTEQVKKWNEWLARFDDNEQKANLINLVNSKK